MSTWIWIRAIDGTGTVQTIEAKLISFGVWGSFYLLVLLVEWVIYFLVKRSKK